MFLVFKFFFFKKASTQSENYLRVNNLLFLVYLILYLHLRNYQAKSDPCEWLILEPGKFHKIIKRWILTLQHWPKITCRNVKCWVAMASVICHTIWVFMFSDFKFLCHFSSYAFFFFLHWPHLIYSFLSPHSHIHTCMEIIDILYLMLYIYVHCI